MEILLVLIMVGIIFFVAYVLLKPKNIPKEYIPPVQKEIEKAPERKNPEQTIPDKYFETTFREKDFSYREKGRNKAPKKIPVPKREVDLDGDFEISDSNVPFYAVLNIDTDSKPSNYNESYLNYNLWPDITKLSYYVFDEKYKLLYSKVFDFEESEIEPTQKYDEFLKDMRSVKILVSHNIDYKIKALKADFLKNGYKLSLFKRQRICLMENTTPIVGIDTGHSEFKWPSFSEMITALFYPDESIEDYEPEEMGDFEWDTKALAKTFIKLS